jgi:hypothetical protein
VNLKLLFWSFFGAILLSAAPIFAGDPHPQPSRLFELAVSAGVAGIDTFRSTETAYSLNPKVILSPRPEPWWIKAGLRLVRLPARKDPWKKIRLIPIFPPIGPGPRPPNPIELRGDQLKIGPTTIVTPELEVEFRPTERFHPSISLGAGFSVEEGASKEVPGLGSFRTSRNNSPLISYGAAFSYNFSQWAAFRLEAQALTSIADAMLVEGPEGQTFRADGGVTTTILTTAGVSFRF